MFARLIPAWGCESAVGAPHGGTSIDGCGRLRVCGGPDQSNRGWEPDQPLSVMQPDASAQMYLHVEIRTQGIEDVSRRALRQGSGRTYVAEADPTCRKPVLR